MTEYYTDIADPRIHMGTAHVGVEDAITFTDSSDSRIRGYISSGKYADGSGAIQFWGLHTGSDFGAGKMLGYLQLAGGDSADEDTVVLYAGRNGMSVRPRVLIASDGDILLDPAHDGGGNGALLVNGPLRFPSYGTGRLVARNAVATSDGSPGTLHDWERVRVPVTFAGTASKDTTYTYAVPFGQRPVILATSADAGAALGNFYAQVLNAGSTSCTVRLRDVDGTARTGSANVDLLAVL